MILKDKKATSALNPRLDAGIKQELDVAFYLRRAYKNSPSVMVFNDLMIHYDDETAQIDHLLVYKYGFIIIESKSIKGHVVVNAQAEWTRSVGNLWVGMPSPIRQAELQSDLLAKFLCNNRTQMVGKLLGIQMSLGGRCYDTLCAISSDAIIDRSQAPADVTGRLVKSEFIVDAITKVMNEIKPWNIIGWIKDTRPTFSKDEMRKICDFILASQGESTPSQAQTSQATLWAEPNAAPPKQTYYGRAHQSPIDIELTPFAAEFKTAALAETTAATPPQSQTAKAHQSPIDIELSALAALQPAAQSNTALTLYAQCKHCGAMHGLTAASGRYGYYVQCGQCGKNTPLKRPCCSCQSHNTKVSRRDQTYKLHCADCQQVTQYSNVS